MAAPIARNAGDFRQTRLLKLDVTRELETTMTGVHVTIDTVAGIEKVSMTASVSSKADEITALAMSEVSTSAEP